MRIAKQRFCEDSLLLPLGCPRVGFSIPNPEVLTSDEIQYQGVRHYGQWWPLGLSRGKGTDFLIMDPSKTNSNLPSPFA